MIKSKLVNLENTKRGAGIRLAAAQKVRVRVANGVMYFENEVGGGINGSHRIHMCNWELYELEAIVDFLKEAEKE